MLAADLIKSEHIGVRELREDLSDYLKKGRTLVVTVSGKPTAYIVPHDKMLKIIEALDDLSNVGLLEMIRKSHEAIERKETRPIDELKKKLGLK